MKHCFVGLFLFSLIACNKKIDDPSPEKLFTLLDSSVTGINFSNDLRENENANVMMYEYFYNGGGVAAADFNNDGLIDLYFSSNMGENKFYLNKGDFKFEDITIKSNASGRNGPWKTGVNAVDINADGLMDIYLCYSGNMPAPKRANQLFINKGIKNGLPVFEDEAALYGLAGTAFSNHSYFLDYDKDGDLDMLLLNHNPKNLPVLTVEGAKKLITGDNVEMGLRLFRNNNNVFEDITVSAGINGSELSYGLGIGIGDFNNDNWPDFYVSNDYQVPDYLYINNKNATFTNTSNTALGHTSNFSMGNDVVDVNNDGLADIFTLDMLPEDNRRQKLLLAPDNYEKFNQNVKSGFYYQYMRNMLQLNNGNGTFSEVGQLAGISNTDWSWSPLFADFDNDGWKDLFITNGYVKDYTNLDFVFYMNQLVEEKGSLSRDELLELIKTMPASNVKNYIFKHNPNGKFTKAGKDWGIDEVSNSNGAVYADLDNDGDLDIVVNNINLNAFVYRNNCKKNNFINIKLLGEGKNPNAIGAAITLYSHSGKQMQYVNPARGYQSAMYGPLHFGLGKDSIADSIRVVWNSGKTQLLTAIAGDTLVVADEKNASAVFYSPANASPIFTRKDLVQRTHSVISSNDFYRQPLLIQSYSSIGPAMDTADVNGDGLTDIVFGANLTIPASVAYQSKSGTFTLRNLSVIDANFNTSAIGIGDFNGDGLKDIYLAAGGYGNLNDGDSLLLDRVYFGVKSGSFSLPTIVTALNGSKGTVSVYDINKDGIDDVFVGGRIIPGLWPAVPQSAVLLGSKNGIFDNRTKDIAPEINNLGMVTSSVFTDLNADGVKELIIAGEWMPVMIYEISGNYLKNSTTKYIPPNLSGWWNTITTDDLNSDGKPDILLGNTGLNIQFRASEKQPLELFSADYDNNGKVDNIFSFFIQDTAFPYLTRDELVGQVPSLKKRFNAFKDYAGTTTAQLFTPEQYSTAKYFSANTMETICFMSTDSNYKKIELPVEAQYSPVFKILVKDVNADNIKDLLLFGNNHHFKLRLGQADANNGILLCGTVNGEFKYVPQYLSGMSVWGDVRSAVFIGRQLFVGASGQPLISYVLTK